jgi:capsular polysaccharide biosynthesis protein
MLIDSIAKLDFEKNNLSRAELYKFSKDIKYFPWSIFYYLERVSKRKLNAAAAILIHIAQKDPKNINSVLIFLDKISAASTPPVKKFINSKYSQLFKFKNIDVWGVISLFNLIKLNITDRNYGLEITFVLSFLDKNIYLIDVKFYLYKLLGEIFLSKGDIIESIYFFTRSVRLSRDHVLVPSMIRHIKKLVHEVDFDFSTLDATSDECYMVDVVSKIAYEPHFKLLPYRTMVANKLAPIDESPNVINNVILRYSSDYLVFANERGSIYKEFSHGVTDFIDQSMLTEDLTFLNLDSISLLPGYGHDNYSHFIYDRLPLLSDLKDESTFILVEIEQRKYLDQLKKYFKNDFVYLSPKKNYLIKSVSLISNHIHPGNYFPTRYLNFYNELSFRLDPPKNISPSFFYIYRPIGRRGILNEEVFHAYLEKNGFVIVRLENYSIEQQINMFMNAKFIIGVHGAGLTNIVFCKSGTNVVEIIPRSYFIDTFLVTASRLNLDYHRFYEDDSLISPSDGELKFNDIFLDINIFDKFLLNILSRTSDISKS